MHRHIAVGALSGVERSVHVLQRMRAYKIDRKHHKRNKQIGERAVYRGILRAGNGFPPPREPQRVQRQGKDCRGDVCRDAEAPEERKRDRRPHGEKRSDHAAEPEPDSDPLFGKQIIRNGDPCALPQEKP